MANVIVNRVKEFLKQYPPFNFLSDELLEEVSKAVELVYFSQGEYLFRQGEAAGDFFYVLKEGLVHLKAARQGTEQVVEYCDEGDVFGVRSLLGRRPYVFDAFAAEDSLVYAVPVVVFERILAENNRVSLYFAAGFASGQIVVRSDRSTPEAARQLISPEPEDIGLKLISGQSPFRYSPDVLTCSLDTSVSEAAKMMRARQVGSIVIVDEQQFPLGIVTDKDLRNRVVASDRPYSSAVEEIMTSPVITIPKNTDFTSLYLTMIKNRLHHLIITEDGSNRSPLSGIVSDHDVLLAQGKSPAVILHALLNTLEVSEMARLRDQTEAMLGYFMENGVAMDFVSNVVTEINDLIIQRAIIIAKNKHKEAFKAVHQTKFCFLSLGSEGRGEQLLRTDMDNAIVYEDPPEDKQEQTREYFLQLGEEIVNVLTLCGFQPCPADIMASNSKWNQPLSVWKKHFERWILNPDQESLLMSSIFFDFREIDGDKALAHALRLHINNEIRKNKIFLHFLAKNALLNPPPLGFFRNFVMEKSGEHLDKFDIKLRAMMPLIDAARVLALSHGLMETSNTIKRLEILAEKEPHNKDFFREVGQAYEIFLRMRTREGLSAGNSGRYITPKALGKLQRKLLKNAFIPIEDIQEIIRVRFQLDYFRS